VIREAIGPGPDDHSIQAGILKDGLVGLQQLLHGPIGVGIGLQAPKEPDRLRIALLLEGQTLFNLVPEGIPGVTASGCKSFNGAVQASPYSQCAVPIGTGQAGVQADLLDPAAEFLPPVVLELQVARGRSPRTVGHNTCYIITARVQFSAGPPHCDDRGRRWRKLFV
jgi:hypothetical protein